MNRIFSLIIVLFFFLSSCSLGGETMKKLSKTEKDIAIETFEKVLGAINSKDSIALKTLFSKKALSETNNIDDSIAKIFSR